MQTAKDERCPKCGGTFSWNEHWNFQTGEITFGPKLCNGCGFEGSHKQQDFDQFQMLKKHEVYKDLARAFVVSLVLWIILLSIIAYAVLP